jgi:NAD(P)-dependent dehydrogenase (short-subunit alcohol dehydrogenase family)
MKGKIILITGAGGGIGGAMAARFAAPGRASPAARPQAQPMMEFVAQLRAEGIEARLLLADLLISDRPTSPVRPSGGHGSLDRHRQAPASSTSAPAPTNQPPPPPKPSPSTPWHRSS